MNKNEFAQETQTTGEAVNKLRLAAVEENMPFVAGILRGAEEAILVAYEMLNNPAVSRREL